MGVIGFLDYDDFVTELVNNGSMLYPVRVQQYHRAVQSSSMPITHYHFYVEAAWEMDGNTYVCRFAVGSVQVLGNPNQAEEKAKIDQLLARAMLLKGVIIDDLQSKLGWLRISAGLIAAASESKCDAGSGKELLG